MKQVGSYFSCFMLISCFSETSIDFQLTARRYVPEIKTLHSLKEIGTNLETLIIYQTTRHHKPADHI
jgi:hypothetical protein